MGWIQMSCTEVNRNKLHWAELKWVGFTWIDSWVEVGFKMKVNQT